MTGRIADGEEDRFVLLFRRRERLGAPGVPVHRVVGVLEQVGGFFAGEVVGVRGSVGSEGSADEEQKRDGGGMNESHIVSVSRIARKDNMCETPSYSSQSTTFRPPTRLNSAKFWVTRVAAFAMAMEAIIRSSQIIRSACAARIHLAVVPRSQDRHRNRRSARRSDATSVDRAWWEQISMAMPVGS